MLCEPDRSSAPKILIVDDDRLLNDALSRAIQKKGYEVVSRFCLTEGYEEAMSNRFDVVYLDIRLPDGDGIKALPEFCKAPSSPKIIIISGFIDSHISEYVINQGAWDCVKKPSSLKKMIHSLETALQHRATKVKTEHMIATMASKSITNNIDLIEFYKYIDLYVIAEKSYCKDLCILCLECITEKCSRLLGKNVIYPKCFQPHYVKPHPLRRATDITDDRPLGKILMFPK